MYLRFSSVEILLHGGGMEDERLSCGYLRSRESHVFFFSSGNVGSLCNSDFWEEVYVLLQFILYEKESD
jgi:hypothetical protein